MIAGMRAMPAELRRNLILWAGWMGPPVAWFVHVVAVYALADGACHGRSLLPLHLATAAALAIAILGGLASRSGQRDAPADPGDSRAARERFMATQGVLAAWLFSTLIVLQWLVVFVLDPCPL